MKSSSKIALGLAGIGAACATAGVVYVAIEGMPLGAQIENNKNMEQTEEIKEKRKELEKKLKNISAKAATAMLAGIAICSVAIGIEMGGLLDEDSIDEYEQLNRFDIKKTEYEQLDPFDIARIEYRQLRLEEENNDLQIQILELDDKLYELENDLSPKY